MLKEVDFGASDPDGATTTVTQTMEEFNRSPRGPTSTDFSTPASLCTASTAPASRSMLYSIFGLSLWPWPGRSIKITRASSANAGTWSGQVIMSQKVPEPADIDGDILPMQRLPCLGG